MARSTSDEEIRLRKRARRRLIGAVALTTLVVVALPMVLDSEPRPIGDDIAVQIPSPGSGPYAPKAEPGKIATRPAVPEPTATAVPAPAAPPAAAADTPTKARVSGTIGSAAAPGDVNIAIAGTGETPGSPPRAAARMEAGKADAAQPEAGKAASKVAPAPADTASPAAGADAARAVPAKPAAEPKKAGKDTETFVVQLGAFADAGRAKERHAQLQKAGIRSYTEVIKTPTGDKTRVRAGPFPTREAADRANEQVKSLGISDGVVVTRRY